MIDRVGEKHGRLEIISFDRRNGKRYYWNCLCSCGTIKSIRYDSLKANVIKSCGCLNKELISKRTRTHGYTANSEILSEYSCWNHIIQRCTNPNNVSYYRYGGRGITICDEWRNSFEEFFKYVGIKPGKEYSIDRINNNGNYEPGNVKWSTSLEQNNNLSTNKKVINIETGEEYSTINFAAKSIGMNPETLRQQLNGKFKNKTNLKLKE